MVTEMIHTASLVHDDVIDMASIRRGKPSVSEIWSCKKVNFVHDFTQLISMLCLTLDYSGRRFYFITCVHDSCSDTQRKSS